VRGKLAGAVRRGADRKGPPLGGTSLAAYPTLKSGGRGDPFVDFNLLALRLWGVPGLALAGDAVRPEAEQALARFGRLYVALDHDGGGEAGAARLAAIFGPRAIRIVLPDGIKDPGQLAARRDGSAIFQAAILRAVEHMTAPPESDTRTNREEPSSEQRS
jgi:DNA primase